MLTMPGPAPAHRWTITRGPGYHAGADHAPLTPAQRIALTIALLNQGFDLLDGVARTTFVGCTRGAVQRRQRPESVRHPLPQG